MAESSRDTPEAKDLARWVSWITRDLTVRELAERFEYGRTQWSLFRTGGKVLPSWLVDKLVRDLIRNPQEQQVQLQLGHKLCRAAETAVNRGAQRRSVPAGTEVELQLRLDDARKAQIEAQQVLLGTTQLIYVLLQLVTSLQSRCNALKREKDRAIADAASAGRIQQEIARTQQKIVQAEKELNRARQTRTEAEELNVAAEVTVASHKLELERAHASPEDTEAPGAAAEDAFSTEADDDSAVDAMPSPLWEEEAKLEAVGQQLEAYDAGLERCRVVVRQGTADNDGTATDSSQDRHETPDTPDRGDVLNGAAGESPSFFVRAVDAPRVITEVAHPEAGRWCLGALYVPKVEGIRLSLGLLEDKPLGLIAEIGDFRFEIMLLFGSWFERAWETRYFEGARLRLLPYGAVRDWTDYGDLLPGWGPSAATLDHSPAIVKGAKRDYQVIVTGCEGPGWAIQLTCFRPLEFIGRTPEEEAFGLLRALLKDSVIDPLGRREGDCFVLDCDPVTK